MKRMGLYRCCLALIVVLAVTNGARAGAYVYGIDVSGWQNPINWPVVKNTDHKDFAFVKATEGVNYVSRTFQSHMTGAYNAGLYVGPYHYARPDSGNSAVAEANDFADAIIPYIASMKNRFLRPALDLEERGSLNRTQLSNWVNTFMKQVQTRTGVEPIIYTNPNYATNYLNSSVSQWDVWIAHWTQDPIRTQPNLVLWDDWVFWQYTSDLSMKGISGRVDGNVFNGTPADLARYAIPEPMTLTLLALGGLAGAVGYRRL